MDREIRLELLLGRTVRNAKGDSLGRIEEIRVNERAEIMEYLLGPAALLERLAAKFVSRHARPRRLHWNQIDLSDPDHPRVTEDAKAL